MSEEIHVGDIIPFILTIKEKGVALDISSVSVKKVYLDDPDPNNNVRVNDIDFLSDGKDGKLKYTTTKEDLYTHGGWRIQVYIEHFPQGSWHTEIKKFKVMPNL